MILSLGYCRCTTDDQEALDRPGITHNETEILKKCDEVECRGKSFVPCVLPCFKPTMDKKISKKCSQCMDKVISCGIKNCKDPCGGINPDKTEIKSCLWCWDHECTRGDLDKCGVSITSTYRKILSMV